LQARSNAFFARICSPFSRPEPITPILIFIKNPPVTLD
jgi:hypothetical protein